MVENAPLLPGESGYLKIYEVKLLDFFLDINYENGLF